MRVQDHAAAEGLHGRVEADDEAVAVLDDDGLLQPELDETLLAGRKLAYADERDPADGLLGVVVEPDARAGLEPARRLLEQREGGINVLRGSKEAMTDDRVAAGELVFFHALEVHGRALAGDGALDRLVV